MEFKKHDWRKFKFNKNRITGEVSIWDNGKQIDRFIFDSTENYKKILRLIKQKYGFSPEQTKKEEDEEIQKEIDFLTGKDYKGGW